MEFKRPQVKASIRSLAFCLPFLLVSGGAWGDQPLPPQVGNWSPPPALQVGNLPTPVPVVPKLAPRILGTLPTPERQPISQFVESVTGGDAIIEVFVGQSRILTTNKPIANENGIGVIASGDPTVIDFDVLPNPRLIRILGKRVGITDLTLVTSDGDNVTYSVHVVYDLPLVQTQMQALFPDASVQLSQLREHVVVKGQARSPSQVAQIIDTLRVYMSSMQVQQRVQQGTNANGPEEFALPRQAPNGEAEGSEKPEDQNQPGVAFDRGQRPSVQAQFVPPTLINLLRVPGPQQVMLSVTIAELNRRALRKLGTNLNIGSDVDGFLNSIQTDSGNLVQVFHNGDFRSLMIALRQNSIATVLAEPNLVTMSGHTARFQSGGEFAVPVPQGGAGVGTTTVQFKPFGVQLSFMPIIEDDETIRLTVEPEVSNIDESLSTSIVQGASPVPGLRTRNASTTVQMREGQTLAIAGLLNNTTSATTRRVPLFGDIPYLGLLFSNNSTETREEELLIVVTPHLVSPLDADEPICLPGQEILEPNDVEFYLRGRIEGRTGTPHRSTTNWDDPLGTHHKRQLEQKHGCGPIGFSE